MTIIPLTVQQLVIMFAYLLIGYALFHGGVLTLAGSRDLAGMLVKLIIPAILVNSFCSEFSFARLKALGQSALLSLLLLGLAILAAHWLFRGRPLDDFGAAFSNAGFMGIPLVQAVLGSEAVLYIVPFVAFLNLLQWTYGVSLIRGEKGHIRLKTLVWNPPVAGILLGLALFASGWGNRLPAVLATPLAGICGLNTPLAMMVLGVYLARENPLQLLRDRRLYAACAVRLVLIPALSLLTLTLLPISRDMGLALLLCAAAPVGANVAVYAQLHGQDHTYASKIVVLSTVLSMISLPLVTAAGTTLL